MLSFSERNFAKKNAEDDKIRSASLAKAKPANDVFEQEGSVKGSSMGESTKSSKDSDDGETMSTKTDPNASDSYKNKFTRRVGKFFKKQAKAFVKNFVDYGPPYNDAPFDDALINECARPVFNFFEVHKILNTKVNPNQSDPEDLYYFPIHWVCRNAHFMGLKMLRRAGAEINVTNELGLSPLDLCVMMKHPPDKRKEQINMALYLLENGANPNNRDKGGYSAIDHAAVNQDLELINMLLDFGANVVRENHILVAQRHHILRNVHDPECYRVLYERLLYEQSVINKERAIKQKEESVKDHAIYVEKLHESLNKKKEKRIAREKARSEAARQAELSQDRTSKIREEMEKNLKAKVAFKQSHGTWHKDYPGSDHWEYKEAIKPRVITDSKELYEINLKTMHSLQDSNDVKPYNARWKAVTGGGSLELNWKKDEPFKLPDIHGGTPSGSVAGSRLGTGRITHSSGGVTTSLPDINYKDENDAELEGEDLDSMMASLSSL